MPKEQKTDNPTPTTREEWRQWQREHRHQSVIGPLILITIGVIFLLNNFGILPWSVWDSIWRFWPVLLIIWGIQIILGRSRLASIISSIIGALLLAFIIAMAVASVNQDFNLWLRQAFPILNQFSNPMM